MGRFFFYGTLLRASGPRACLGVASRPRFVGECAVRRTLCDLGAYPGLVAGPGLVPGECFELLDDEAIALLDRCEGFDPARPESSEFIRRRVELVGLEGAAWVYFYNRHVGDRPVIESGRRLGRPGAGRSGYNRGVANQVKADVRQVGPATSEARVREHRVMVDRPTEKGGEDRGPMGGELLLAALGGCFMSNLLAAIRARAAAIRDVRVEVAGVLDGSPTRFTAITLDVSAETDDRELLAKLATMSERACIVSATLRDAVKVELRVVESADRSS